MTFFPYHSGALHVEDVPVADLAATVGTPFYVYAEGAIEAAYRNFSQAFAGQNATICYAVKANANLAVIRALALQGAGADVVSEGELRAALAAGVSPDKIVFAGVGKTQTEMAAGLDAGIKQFNVESIPELEALSRVAADKGKIAPVALRLNPDVDAKTHEKISTGMATNKFGIDIGHADEAIARAAELPGVRIDGLAVHIGSQLTDIEPYRAAFTRIVALYRRLQADGQVLKRLDFGGGLGITYQNETPPDVQAYADMVRDVTAGLDAELVFEPGRVLVGNAGLLVTRVLYVKEGTARRFVIVDAAMNDLIRPPLYDAWHDIIPAQAAPAGAEMSPVDIVGPVCESTDIFARQRPLPPVAAGDLLAICSVGAYSAVMASTYNSRLLAPEVLVRGSDYAVVRQRLDYDTLIGQDRLPEWLNPEAALTRRAAEG